MQDFDEDTTEGFGAKPKKKAHKARKPKTPRKMTQSRMANIALHYLERYSSSSKNLAQVLERRLIKTSYAHPDTDMAEARQWIDDLINRYIEVGLLDDGAYALAKTRSGLERGEAPRSVAMKLAQKGVAKEHVENALEELIDDFPIPELQAALTLTRKKRMGPYRADEEKRKEMREKDLSHLARAGFSYDTAKTMIDAEDVNELEQTIEEYKT